MPIVVHILEAEPESNGAVVRVVHDGHVVLNRKAIKVPVYAGKRRLDLFEQKIRELCDAECANRDRDLYATPVRLHRAAR